MANIYELTGAFNALWNLIDEGEIADEVLEEVFKNTSEELSIKLEGYCKFIKNLESDIKGLKAEEDRLAEKRRRMENTISRSKEAMKKAVMATGDNKIPCGNFTVAVQKNPPSLKLDASIADIPSKYLIPQEPKVDTKMLTDDLKASEKPVPYAHLEQGTSLRIR